MHSDGPGGGREDRVRAIEEINRVEYLIVLQRGNSGLYREVDHLIGRHAGFGLLPSYARLSA